jgi:cytochrome c oxidase assembly protein subunit 15
LKEERRWLRWLGVAALGAVILQGVLGGLRVTQMKDALGVFHATLAQLFFALMGSIALFTSGWWKRVATQKMSIYAVGPLRYSFATVTGLILFQLILGATMRHQHAGLAISDFPAAYGRFWPAMDPASVARYNQARGEVVATNPITAFQIGLQMAHRMTAFAILVSVAWVAGTTRRRLGGNSILSRVSLGWFGLVLFQAGLGAATIWTNKAADIATAHVAGGALSLVTGVLLALVTTRMARCAAERTTVAPFPTSTGSPQSEAMAIP